MNIKSVKSLSEFVERGVQSQKWLDEVLTEGMVGSMEITRILVGLQSSLSAVGDKIHINENVFDSDRLFFHMYDCSESKDHLKICIRVFNGNPGKVPDFNQNVPEDLFKITVYPSDGTISLSIKEEHVFSGDNEDLISVLSGRENALKIIVGEDHHVHTPISKIINRRPTADLVLQLWHNFADKHQQDAVVIGKKLFGYLKSICEFMRSSGNKVFNPSKCYMVFVQSEFRGVKFFKLGVVDIDSNKPQFVIIPRCEYESDHKAAVSGHFNNFTAPLVHGTMADVRAFFGRKSA